jgi:adenosylcobinamide amidohydrolase
MTDAPAEPTDTPTQFVVETHADTGVGEPGPVLVWRLLRPMRAISSGMLGGGITEASWVINAHVRADYGRLDPGAHLREIALAAGLVDGCGIGLMTAARVERVATSRESGVRCDATVGVSYPTWAAAPNDDLLPETPWRPGTINIVCQLPVPVTDGALVGAVITATEAKSQALAEGGVPGTGTASDAIVICCPPASGGAPPQPFAGPRSPWGARLARVVHAAVAEGLRS